MLLSNCLCFILLNRIMYASTENNNGINLKIAGGQQAARGSYPFMASLRETDDNSHFCGGTVLSSKFILTAAHCLQPPLKAQQLTVLVGTNSLSSGGTILSVLQIINHPAFNPETCINDIALLELKDNIKMSQTVKPVFLHKNCLNDNVKHSVEAIGWGCRSMLYPIPVDRLQCVNLQTGTRAQCRSFWQNVFGLKQICAMYPFRGICKGDSGGPLLYNGQQIGIASYGSCVGCGKKVPDVYTKICVYQSWINSYTNFT